MTDSITVTGVVGSDPRLHVTTQGLAIASFRLASTRRYFDRAKGTWEDGETNWYTVSGFRQLASNAMASVHKGDRVVVQGRLRVRAWENGEKSGIAVEIEADSIGHDLAWGTTVLTKVRREGAGEGGQATATGGPGESGESNAWPGVEQQVAADVEDGSDPATDGLTEDFGDEDGDEVDGAREDRPRLEPVF
ncbi:single-stranded DNA-binding protein [Agromyces mariniharenae]|uniref:Single-stranded DNA-binding protein n=1 Tax=Agromyces mariniharenae TaxID=2604423 RepID=A0A5S4UX28_9MICO|nr:single-stranded DNA-binding protein [Agromyces mariniharenae]TYL50698.1 single-stranded DNA-binding protein [Agromyces mariniharenae]